MEARVRDTARKAREAQAQAQAVQSALGSLRIQSEAIEETVSILRSKADQKWEVGKRPVGFSGDGERHDLTGMKHGGDRNDGQSGGVGRGGAESVDDGGS